jgi:hypothetical protein
VKEAIKLRRDQFGTLARTSWTSHKLKPRTRTDMEPERREARDNQASESWLFTCVSKSGAEFLV